MSIHALNKKKSEKLKRKKSERRSREFEKMSNDKHSPPGARNNNQFLSLPQIR